MENWVDSLALESARDFNTHKIGITTLANYSQIAGLGHAIRSCPWFWQEGSLACYQSGLSKNPVAQTISTLLAPIRVVLHVGSCANKESGPTGMTACLFSLNDQERKEMEEKVEVIATFAGLLLLWYATLPAKEKKQEKKPL